MKILVRSVGYLLFLGIAILACGELFIGFVPDSLPLPPYDTAQMDWKLGWKPKADYLYDGPMSDLNGKEYSVYLTTNDEGFRRYPKERVSEKYQILVIGDSYTQAVEVSDDKTYYRYFEDSLQAQVYAYGMAGYGTMQELMVLDRYLTEIEPDLVLWQFCSNDFIDNDLGLERDASYRVGLRRPYWDSKEGVTYGHPEGTLATVMQQTKFLRFCWKKTQGLRMRFNQDTLRRNSEEQIALGKEESADYARSIETTVDLLRQVQDRLGNEQQLVVFSADPYKPQSTDLALLCKDIGVALIPFPEDAFYRMRSSAEVYTHDGYHWNELGHQLIGSEIAKTLRPYLERVSTKHSSAQK